MRTMEQFVLKNKQTVLRLAKAILLSRVGDTITTIQSFAYTFGVSLGTIQRALVYLEQEGAITLRRRGHKGTILVDRDTSMLWQLAGYQHLLCVMPVPYSIRYQALAMALLQAFPGDIPFHFAHMRGAETRLDLLEQGVFHCTVLPDFAIQQAMQEGRAIMPALGLGPGSYVSRYVAVGKLQPKRIGVDASSTDRSALTYQSFPKPQGYQYITLSYDQFLPNLAAGNIDAAIWNEDDILEGHIDFPSMGVNVRVLNQLPIEDSPCEAVLAVHAQDHFLQQYFSLFMDVDSIRDVQSRVLKHEAMLCF